MKHKKILSFFLILVFVFGLAVPASASTARLPEEYIDELDNGFIYSTVINNHVILIFSKYNSQMVEVGIKDRGDVSSPVFNFVLDKNLCTKEEAPSAEFWSDVISYCYENIDQADVVYVKHEFTAHERPDDGAIPLVTRASANADLVEDLEEWYGEEYAGEVLYTTTEHGLKFQIKEQMGFFTWLSGTDSITEKISAISYLTDLLGYVPVATVQTFCKAMEWVLIGADLLPSGVTVNFYTCEVRTSRTVHIDGSIYPYYTTTRMIVHDGFENAERNNRDRAYASPEISSTSYIPNETEFNDYDTQIEEAYFVYQTLGPQA